MCPSCARWVHRCACPNRDIVHRTSSVAYLVRAVDEGWSPAISRRILRTAHRWVRRCFSAWTGYTLHAKRSAVLAAQDALSRMQRMYADAAFVEARAFTEYMVLCRAIANCEDEVREARRYCGLDRPRARSLIPGELAVSAHNEWRRTRPLLAAPCESISPHGASAHRARWALTPDCSAGATAGTMAAEPGGSSVVAIRPVRQWLSAGAVSWKTPDTMLGARSRDRGPAFEEIEEIERRAERNVAGEGARDGSRRRAECVLEDAQLEATGGQQQAVEEVVRLKAALDAEHLAHASARAQWEQQSAALSATWQERLDHLAAELGTERRQSAALSAAWKERLDSVAYNGATAQARALSLLEGLRTADAELGAERCRVAELDTALQASRLELTSSQAQAQQLAH